MAAGAERVCESGKSLDELVAARIKAVSLERRNQSQAADAKKLPIEAENAYGKAPSIDHTDGLSVDFEDWRFNVRASNTEPLVRLNVESRGDAGLMQAKTAELLKALEG